MKQEFDLVGESLQPLPHQIEAIQRVASGLSERSPSVGQLIMPCGTGKTLTALWIKETLQSTGVLPGASLVSLLFPSLALLNQTLNAWLQARSKPWRALVICSDSDVGADSEHFGIVHSSHFTVKNGTTDSTEILEFIRDDQHETVVFCTYQSSQLLADTLRRSNRVLDLVICDEAHRLVGALGRPYSVVLNRVKFPATRRLFLTATPKYLRLGNVQPKDDCGPDHVGMDTVELFGPVLYSLSFGQALKSDLLCDYRLVVTVVRDSEIRKRICDKSLEAGQGNQQETSIRVSALGLLRAAEKFGLRRIVTFHRNIERSKHFCEMLTSLQEKEIATKSGELRAFHVDGQSSTPERERILSILNDQESGLTVVSNSRCLTEGIDVPALDGVLFADPRRSEVDVIQAVGRAIRKAPNKEIGYVIVPIVCSSTDESAAILDSEGFDRIREVLVALRAHDEAFAIESPSRVDTGCKGSVRKIFGGRIILDLTDLSTENDLDLIASKLEAEIVDAGGYQAIWETNFVKVKNFHDKRGRWPRQGVADPEEHILGIWVNTQRTQQRQFNEGKYCRGMNSKRFELLTNTPGWISDAREAQVNGKLLEIRAFKIENGHLPRRVGPSTSEQRSLANWIKNVKCRVNREIKDGRPASSFGIYLSELVDLGILTADQVTAFGSHGAKDQ